MIDSQPFVAHLIAEEEAKEDLERDSAELQRELDKLESATDEVEIQRRTVAEDYDELMTSIEARRRQDELKFRELKDKGAMAAEEIAMNDAEAAVAKRQTAELRAKCVHLTTAIRDVDQDLTGFRRAAEESRALRDAKIAEDARAREIVVKQMTAEIMVAERAFESGSEQSVALAELTKKNAKLQEMIDLVRSSLDGSNEVPCPSVTTCATDIDTSCVSTRRRTRRSTALASAETKKAQSMNMIDGAAAEEPQRNRVNRVTFAAEPTGISRKRYNDAAATAMESLPSSRRRRTTRDCSAPAGD